jgi:hypothetical protein
MTDPTADATVEAAATTVLATDEEDSLPAMLPDGSGLRKFLYHDVSASV